MVKIILVERNGLQLKREFIQRPLGYLIKLKMKKERKIDIRGMAPVWTQSTRCVKQKGN